MAQVKLNIGAVNITNYLIGRIRKGSDPSAEVAREVYAPPHNTIRNVVIPAVGDVDPVTYYVDFYESSDGSSLDLLLGQFVYDVKEEIPISEKRRYITGGSRDIDPAPDQNKIIDPYLDGKNITEVFKEGFRPLVPPTETFKEYDHTGDTIELLNGQVFSLNEVAIIEITYRLPMSQGPTTSGLYSGVEVISEDTTLDTSHRGKRLKCETDESKLTVTLEDISSVTDGSFYYFNSNGGSQKKVRILPFSSVQKILIDGEVYDEISIGKGEFVRLEKYVDIWEATVFHPGLVLVGEKFSKGTKNANNAIPGDGSLIDGDIEPRLYYFVSHLPSTHVITDDTVTNSGYVHPVGKEGMWVIHSSERKFRMPNLQNRVERGLKDFNAYGPGTDNTRGYNYPGGTKEDGIKTPDTGLKFVKAHAGMGGKIEGYGPGNAPGADNYDPADWPFPTSDETRVKDYGDIKMIRS